MKRKALTGWAHLHVRSEWIMDVMPADINATQRAYRMANRYRYGHQKWIVNELDVYDDDWKELVTLPRTCIGVGHGKHNWRSAERFDVTFYHPLDGWSWYGRCITGDYGNSFKTRRTTSSPHLLPNLPWAAGHPRAGQHPLRHNFKCPIIEPDDGGTFRVDDGRVTKWFAKKFADGWHYAPTFAEIFAERLTGAPLPA